MSGRMLGVSEIATLWGVTMRRVTQLCSEGKIEGAVKIGKFWRIPEDALMPAVLRSQKVREESPVYGTAAKLPFALGKTSYIDIASECYYVDKTEILKDIIDEHGEVVLFTRPRRFGKTLTLNMMKTFFEISDEDTSVYFKDKKIWKAGEKYRAYQGSYPVIWLSFKDTHLSSWESMYKKLVYIIKNEFRRHQDILNNERITESERIYFQKVLNMETGDIDYQSALYELSYMLRRCYQKKVIILIDEYDTPIQQGYFHGYYEKIVEFMRGFFSEGLKDNENLEFGIITGILRVAKESLFSGLNNLVVNSLIDKKYNKYFGFTEDEVVEIARYYGHLKKLGEIKAWYDGYKSGSTDIYNPWSVISYFQNDCTPKAYWSRTSSNDIIGKLIKDAGKDIYDNLISLMQGEEIHAIIDTNIIFPELDDSVDAIYSFLLMAGYLKITEVLVDTYDKPLCGLTIPNKEIKGVFQSEILNSFKSFYPVSVIRNFGLALYMKDTELFKETLQNFLEQSVSYYDTAHENFYHGLVLGMLSIMSDKYFILSNRESGDGRFDVQLAPSEKHLPGYIMEFKVGKDLDEFGLQALAKSAVNQACEKRYDADMRYKKVDEIYIYGIAFSGKCVAVCCDRIAGIQQEN